MALDYDSAIGYRSTGNRVRYCERDASLYALSLGFGTDPMCEAALDFLLETRGPKVMPTMATVLVKSISRAIGLDMKGVLHAAQRLEVMAPLPPVAEIEWEAVVSGIIDKGRDKGAVVTFDTTGRLAGNAEPLFVLRNTVLARRDGGCGGPSGSSPARQSPPDRAADLQHAIQTRPDQALLYRLNGDLNPLHAEPAVAREAGFSAPVLHGLCTYGIACRAIVESVCALDPGRICSFEGRFTAPVFPGDEIVTEIWIEGDDAFFRCGVPARQAIVIDGGKCSLRPAPETPQAEHSACTPDR